jgi:sigma-B regulation protein RsbU (phosphoserine phosphatase)
MSRIRNFETLVFGKLRRPSPAGRVHRGAFWLFLGYLVFGLLGFLPGGWGETSTLVADIALLALIPLCLILFLRWIFGHFLWKVRNRLILTYLLMGFAPVVLFVTLAAIALYIFSGQFAIFVGNAESNAERMKLAAQNQVFALHVADDIAAGTAPQKITLPEAKDLLNDGEFANTRLAVFVDGKPVPLQPANLEATDIPAIPKWAGRAPFEGLVTDHELLYLRAIDTVMAAGHHVTVIISMPLEDAVVDRIAAGLGTAMIWPTSTADEIASGNAGGIHVKVAGEPRVNPKQGAVSPASVEVPHDAIVGGKLPAKQHFYDIPIAFYGPLATTDWTTGKLHAHGANLTMQSRPSLLYARLFNYQQMMNSSNSMGVVVRDVLIGIAVLFGLLELVAFYGAVRLNTTITQSIRDLYEATEAIDRGDFEHRIQVKRRDQLAALSQSFNVMTASLARLLEEQREKQRLQSELAIAQEVQANLFPQGNIRLAALEVHGICLPARTVSGDYYDFLQLGDDALGLALGDISGKGISAALLMASLHSAVRAYRFAGEELVSAGNVALATAGRAAEGEQEIECGELFEEPSKILSLLNRHLYRSTQPEKYATLFLAHFDAEASRLTYSNGGQLPPLLLRVNGSVERLDRGGTVVGLLDNMVYEQDAKQMYPGDILIAYSDGVTEPENEFGDFGEDRLVDVVQRHRHLPLEVISGQVMQALRNWIGVQEQPDDITLVLARAGRMEA